MRCFLAVLTPPVLALSVFAADPAYQRALDEVLKEYPPGDYNDRPVRRFSGNRVKNAGVSQFSLERALLEPVDHPDKDLKTLFSEAASFFVEGRWDLSLKRYKQSLLLDPENIGAKARLLDLLTLMSLYQAESWKAEAVKRKKFSEWIAKDIVPEAEIRK